MDLSWEDNSDDELSFAVEYKENNGGEWRLLKGVEQNTTSTTVGANNRNYFFDWTTDRDLSPNTSYAFRILAYKANDKKSYSNEITVTTGETVEYECGSGTGLIGNYFDNPDESNAFETEPIITRIDSVVDFNWKSESPGDGLNKDHFHVLWTGQIEAPFTGWYTIYANIDQFSRVWLNGERIIVNWWGWAKGYAQETVHLEAGQKYNLRFEYRDWTGSAKAELYWATPSMEKQIIPQCFLYPDTGDIVSARPAELQRMTSSPRHTPSAYLVYSMRGRLIATIEPGRDAVSISRGDALNRLMRTMPRGVYSVCRRTDGRYRGRTSVERVMVR